MLLPQGRFAEFLQAKPRERQDLLVQLLAFGVYEQAGQRARERAQRAADKMADAQHSRAELTDATEEAETLAAARVAALTTLAGAVAERLADLTALREQAVGGAAQAAPPAMNPRG